MDLFQWGHDPEVMVRGPVSPHRRGEEDGFNGATTFQPWIELQYARRAIELFKFQWGHDFSAMDREERGVIKDGNRYEGFNGATTFQPWIGNPMLRL